MTEHSEVGIVKSQKFQKCPITHPHVYYVPFSEENVLSTSPGSLSSISEMVTILLNDGEGRKGE